MKTIAYLRISSDALDKRTGVTRQRIDLLALAKRLGLPEPLVIEDNDESALSGKRPGFKRLLSEVRAGRVEHLLVTSQDRLGRDLIEVESTLRLCREKRTRLITLADGEIDLETVGGRLTSRVRAVVSQAEGEIKAERIRDANTHRAANGKAHAEAGFGFRRIRRIDARGNITGWHDVIDEEQAEVVRAMAGHVLGGWSIQRLLRELDEAGIRTARGTRWTNRSLVDLLRSPRVVGDRVHLGEVVGRTEAGPILDRTTWLKVGAILSDPTRRRSTSSIAVHLLTHLLVCGVCGSKCHRHTDLSYRCRKAGHVSRRQGLVDSYVAHTVCWALANPDATTVLSGTDTEVADLIREADELRERLDEARLLAGQGRLSLASLVAVEAGTAPRLESLQDRLRAAQSPVADLSSLAGYKDAYERFEQLDLVAKRRVLSALLSEVRILPGAKSGLAGFDHSKVVLVWRFPQLDPVR